MTTSPFANWSAMKSKADSEAFLLHHRAQHERARVRQLTVRVMIACAALLSLAIYVLTNKP